MGGQGKQSPQLIILPRVFDGMPFLTDRRRTNFLPSKLGMEPRLAATTSMRFSSPVGVTDYWLAHSVRAPVYTVTG